MRNPLIVFAASALALLIACSNAIAKDKKADSYLEAAKPYLHLSCKGLIDTYGKDEKKMAEVVELMIAVSVINREIDITKLLDTDTDKAEFGDFLKKALTAQCKEDAQSLMVSNVDRAIVYAFAERPDEK